MRRCPPNPVPSAGSASSTSTSATAHCATSPPGTPRHAKLFDRCEEKDGIVPFDKLVEQFMSVEPYNKARRVFVIVETVPSNYSFGRCDFGLVDEIELEMGGGRDPLAALLLDRRTERDAQALAVAAVGGELVVADPVVHRAA